MALKQKKQINQINVTCLTQDPQSSRSFWYAANSERIQDFSDHEEWIPGSFDAPRSERSWIDLFNKETQNPFSDSFDLKNSILDFLKESVTEDLNPRPTDYNTSALNHCQRHLVLPKLVLYPCVFENPHIEQTILLKIL